MSNRLITNAINKPRHLKSGHWDGVEGSFGAFRAKMLAAASIYKLIDHLPISHLPRGKIPKLRKKDKEPSIEDALTQ